MESKTAKMKKRSRKQITKTVNIKNEKIYNCIFIEFLKILLCSLLLGIVVCGV